MAKVSKKPTWTSAVRRQAVKAYKEKPRGVPLNKYIFQLASKGTVEGADFRKVTGIWNHIEKAKRAHAQVVEAKNFLEFEAQKWAEEIFKRQGLSRVLSGKNDQIVFSTIHQWVQQNKKPPTISELVDHTGLSAEVVTQILLRFNKKFIGKSKIHRELQNSKGLSYRQRSKKGMGSGG